MTTRIALRSLRPVVTWRLVVTVLGFVFLAFNPLWHPLELLVLIPAAFFVQRRDRWLVPTLAIAFPIAMVASQRAASAFFPDPRGWADGQLHITMQRLPLTADQQTTLWRQYYEYQANRRRIP